MFALQVLVNGKHVLTAGVEDWDLIHANLMAKRARTQSESAEYELSIGGLTQQTVPGKHEHVRWARRSLGIGDEVTVRLVDVPNADPPTKRYRSDKTVQESPFTEQEMKQMRYESYLLMKKEFEGADD